MKDTSHSLSSCPGLSSSSLPQPQEAIGQGRTEMQLRQQARRDRLLKEVSLQIRQSLDLTEILDTTVTEVRHLLQADRMMVYRLDSEQNGHLVAAAAAEAYPIDSNIHQIWIRVTASRDEASTDQASEDEATNELPYIEANYQIGEIGVVEDVDQLQLFPSYQQILQQLQVRAKLVVPIRQGEVLWGLLAAHQCSTPRCWDLLEIDLLEQLATHLAIAIQQAQLFQQVQQQAQQEKLLNQISRSISSSLDPDHILQEIAKLTGECFRVDRVQIFTLNTHELYVVKEWLASAEIPSMLTFKVPLSEWPDLVNPHFDAPNHQALHVPRLDALPLTPALRQQIEQGQSQSVLCAPIVIRSKLFGGLSLTTTLKHRTFTQSEIHLLERIANQVAIALYNAHSYEHLEQVVQERTRELEAEKRISEAANRAKSEFLAIMSHELRTPLNAVLGLSELLGKEIFGSLNTKQQEYIDCIHSSGEHLLALISDILDLSKVEAGKEELTLGLINVDELCSGCLSIVGERAAEAQLQLISQIDPNLQSCVADERRLRQMILNLLSNAIKFTPDGTVSLIVEKQPAGISFTVADTGIGIAPEHLSKLFQPFQQIDTQLNRRYEGTGLGLALTDRLAQLHGGHVTVESRLGQGSRFTIYLPEAGPPESPCSTHTLPSTFACSLNPASDLVHYTADSPLTKLMPPRQQRVLIMESNPNSAALLKNYLKALGYQVCHLTEFLNSLPQVQEFRPDLILIDIQPAEEGMGFDLLTILRQNHSSQNLPIIMVAALTSRGDRDRWLAAGVTDFISRPVSILQLESVLLRCL